MNLSAWAEQRAKYSRARHGRNERGAILAECALVEAMARAVGHRLAREASEAAAPAPAAA